MFKPVIVGITALSLAFASTTSAFAQGMDREDVGKLLIGLAAVAVIGAALEENRDRNTGNQTSDNTQQGGINRNNDWSHLNREHQRSADSRRVLPEACFQAVETRYGTQRLFGLRCLERNYRHVNRLPENCAVRLYASNGPVRGFDPLCLREEGFRSDRRH